MPKSGFQIRDYRVRWPALEERASNVSVALGWFYSSTDKQEKTCLSLIITEAVRKKFLVF